jgi:hypothetical protein
MFEVMSCKHVSTTVTRYSRFKVWIIETRSRSKAQTLLLSFHCFY